MDKFREKEGEPVKPRGDAKSTLRGAPTAEFVLYLALSAACVGVWALAAMSTVAAGGTYSFSKGQAGVLALLAGAGPVAVAFGFAYVQYGVRSFLEPFEKKALWANALHLALGNLFCVVPVAVACYWALI